MVNILRKIFLLFRLQGKNTFHVCDGLARFMQRTSGVLVFGLGPKNFCISSEVENRMQNLFLENLV